ncbi:MAG TPA: PH domain-containing protein [Planctomycetaceae bacterium]|nr:PH domain-containing protein [Planctomycetaceae bacterium]
MTSTKRPPAISGVSTGKSSALIMTVYPSIAGNAYGQLLGQLMECIPARIGGIRLSNLLFGPVAALLAVPEFFRLKVHGVVYTLTNRSVQVRTSRGNRLVREVPLADIAQVSIRQLSGQQFYPAAEIDLFNKAGDLLLTLSGIPRADVFRQTILEARSARNQVESSLTTICARHAG